MITPRLYRKAVAGALQWRLLLLWWAALIVPGAVAALPVMRFLQKHLDHATHQAMDGAVLLDLLKQLGENGAGEQMFHGAVSAALVLLFLSPFVAGAALTAARSDEPLPLQRLLAGAGEYYGRMLRTAFAGLVPLGIGGALAALAFKLADKANQSVTTETLARRNLAFAAIAGGAAVLITHVLVDAARAQFAADPSRRSAVMAHWAALRVIVRRPVRSLGLAGIAVLLGPGIAFALMALRLQITQAGLVRIGLAWLLAQGAQVTIGWGRNSRIFGFAELSRADTADRERSGKPFAMAEPATSPPPAMVESSTLGALDPPRGNAVR